MWELLVLLLTLLDHGMSSVGNRKVCPCPRILRPVCGINGEKEFKWSHQMTGVQGPLTTTRARRSVRGNPWPVMGSAPANPVSVPGTTSLTVEWMVLTTHSHYFRERTLTSRSNSGQLLWTPVHGSEGCLHGRVSVSWRTLSGDNQTLLCLQPLLAGSWGGRPV